eukprot:CAMPEP_0197025984 /NCGR_PEP_ID=MMETSP1384-20130603/6174_1 /TAXON_ID=29189 /ORGANISM="Ammonia sp." /LENGTH=709 /DNA_ID=CAMNT_0042454583 /DNA_START=126 /DNA_END=2255 /DNA_ORIENTATION=-
MDRTRSSGDEKERCKSHSVPNLTPSVSSLEWANDLQIEHHHHHVDFKQAALQDPLCSDTDIEIQISAGNTQHDLWLICDQTNTFRLITGSHQLPPQQSRWTPLPLTLSKNHSSVSMPWSYYRDLTISRIQHPVLCSKPCLNYFIVAQLAKHGENQPNEPNHVDSLQQRLIGNIHKLAQDECVKYDLFGMQTQNYLYCETGQFGKQQTMSEYLTLNISDDYGATTPPIYYCQHLALDNEDSCCSSDSDILSTPRFVPALQLTNNYSRKYSNQSLQNLQRRTSAQAPPGMTQMLSVHIPTPQSTTCFRYEQEVSPMAIPSPMNKHKQQQKQQQVQTPLDYSMALNAKGVKPQYDDSVHCMTYSVEEMKQTNTAFVHCLIDPNKNLNDHHLWIPTEFNPQSVSVSEMIRSPILGLDYVKYKDLYQCVAALFKRMQPMFENVLNRKLGGMENVIVSLKQYVLQKAGDFYDETLHKVGMGENVECIGMYYVDGNLRSDGMKFSLIDNTANYDHILQDVRLEKGDCVVFRNEAYHKLQRMVFDETNENKTQFRTILSFCILNNEENIMSSDCKDLSVNLQFNWRYVIDHWLRTRDDYDCDCDGCCGYRCEINVEWMTDVVFIYLFGHNHDEYTYNRRHKMLDEKRKVMMQPNEVKLRMETKKHCTKFMPVYNYDDLDNEEENEFQYDLFETPLNQILANSDVSLHDAMFPHAISQ